MGAARIPIPKNPGFWRRGSRVGFYYRDGRDVRRQATAETLTAAKAKRAELETDVRRGEHRAESSVTLAAYIETWLASYEGRTRSGLKSFTVSEYRRMLNTHVIPSLGRIKLAAVEPRDVKALVSSLKAKGLSAKTIRNIVVPLKALYADAFEEGLVRANPTAVRLTGTPTKDKPKHLEPEQLEALFAATPEDWKLFLRLLVYSGARVGEYLELRWSDVDLKTGTMAIARRVYRGEVDKPKSTYGVRTLPLTAGLKAELVAHKIGSKFSGPDDLVFCTSRGTAHLPENMRKRWLRDACLAAGLVKPGTENDKHPKTWVGFHALRHTCGTMQARAGRRPEEIQAWLGHHAASFTLDTYIGRPKSSDLMGLDLLETKTAG